MNKNVRTRLVLVLECGNGSEGFADINFTSTVPYRTVLYGSIQFFEKNPNSFYKTYVRILSIYFVSFVLKFQVSISSTENIIIKQIASNAELIA